MKRATTVLPAADGHGFSNSRVTSPLVSLARELDLVGGTSPAGAPYHR